MQESFQNESPPEAQPESSPPQQRRTGKETALQLIQLRGLEAKHLEELCQQYRREDLETTIRALDQRLQRDDGAQFCDTSRKYLSTLRSWLSKEIACPVRPAQPRLLPSRAAEEPLFQPLTKEKVSIAQEEFDRQLEAFIEAEGYQANSTDERQKLSDLFIYQNSPGEFSQMLATGLRAELEHLRSCPLQVEHKGASA